MSNSHNRNIRWRIGIIFKNMVFGRKYGCRENNSFVYSILFYSILCKCNSISERGWIGERGRGVNICRFIKPNNLLSPPPRLIKISTMFETVIIQAKPYDELMNLRKKKNLKKLNCTMKYNCTSYKKRIKS